MCELNSLPYVREIILAFLFIAIAVSFFKKEKCPCKDEIEELKTQINGIKSK